MANIYREQPATIAIRQRLSDDIEEFSVPQMNIQEICALLERISTDYTRVPVYKQPEELEKMRNELLRSMTKALREGECPEDILEERAKFYVNKALGIIVGPQGRSRTL